MGAILCVDDEPLILLPLKERLSDQFGNEYDIRTAQSAKEALKIVDDLFSENISLDLIISDCILPDMKGDQLLIEVYKLSPNTKKILLTEESNKESVVKLVNKVGLYRYIAKPCDENDLIMTVKEALKSLKNEKELLYYTQQLEETVQNEHIQNQTYLDIIDNYLIASKTDLNGVIIDASKAMCDITGYAKEELIGKKHNIIRHPDMPAEAFRDLWKNITQGRVWEGEVKNRKKDGSSYWVKTRVSPSFDKEGNIIGYGSIRVDISDKKRVEELSVTDELTMLYNRRYFNYIFPREISRASREDKKIGFAIFDVDNFKPYNDNYGHHKGDKVLESIANCVQNNLHRAGDYAFRLGGEEFGILVYDTTIDGFSILMENIRKAIYNLEIEHKYNGYFEYISASFGGTVFDGSSHISKDNIYQLADKLLYFAKENGRNRIKVESFESIDQDNFESGSEAVNEFISQKIKFEKNQTKLFSNLIENSNDMIFILQVSKDERPKIVFANEMAKNKLGYTLEEMEELDIDDIRKPLEGNEKFKEHAQKLKRYQNINEYAYFICKNGNEFPIEASVKTANYNDTMYKIAIVRDVSNRFNYIKELEKNVEDKTNELQENLSKLKSYKEAMDVNSIVTISDPKGVIKYANDKFYEISGFSEDEIIGSNHNIVRHPDMPKKVFKELWETIKEKKVWKGQIKNRKKDGGYYIVQSAIVPILDNKGDVLEYIATRYEITELYKKTAENQKLANTNFLTGLGNRNKLIQTIEKIDKGSIALIDINNFHEINDFYGEKTGDEVIIRFGELLKKNLSQFTKLFHLQGDEFVILDTVSTQNRFRRDMKRLNDYFNNETIVLDDKIFHLSTTISLSFEDPKILLSTVNLARTYAKEKKLLYNVYSFERSMEKEYANNFKWTSKIKKAIKEDRITVFLQPIVDTMSEKIVKYESLVRLIDEDGTIVSPYFFLDIAKKSNYYGKITQIVIDKTLKFLERTDKPISVNITKDDIENRYIKKFIFDKLDKCTKCDKITFELVESEGIENFDEVTKFIKHIKSYGCKLAIDDFGTGYSNFEYLLKLNADFIKIDGSIIKEIDQNEDQYYIVKSITDFAKVKNIELIAEFVSSAAIHEKIKSLNINCCQGYYFGEPKPIEL